MKRAREMSSQLFVILYTLSIPQHTATIRNLGHHESVNMESPCRRDGSYLKPRLPAWRVIIEPRLPTWWVIMEPRLPVLYVDCSSRNYTKLSDMRGSRKYMDSGGYVDCSAGTTRSCRTVGVAGSTWIPGGYVDCSAGTTRSCRTWGAVGSIWISEDM